VSNVAKRQSVAQQSQWRADADFDVMVRIVISRTSMRRSTILNPFLAKNNPIAFRKSMNPASWMAIRKLEEFVVWQREAPLA
jgi:hypothetical protein